MALVVRKLGATIEIRYHDVPIFTSAAATEVVRSLMASHLSLALNDVVGFIADEAPVNTGALSQSFAAEITGTTLEDMAGRVFSPLPHAIVIDQGRTPGARMPPIDAIELWVKRKGLHYNGDKKHFSALSSLDQDNQLRSMAWAIAKKIQREGIEARNFVAAGWARAEPRVDGVFDIMATAIAIALVSDEGGSGSGSPGGMPSRPRPGRSFTSGLL